MKNTQLAFIVMTAVLLSPLMASAIMFNNEQIQKSPTDFYWTFDNPWNKDKEVYNENLRLFIDNVNCQDASIKMYAITPVTYSTTECSMVSACHDELKSVYDNKTSTTKDVTVQVCADEKQCRPVQKTIIEKYDLEKTDYLLSSADRILIEGHRKASTGFVSCDMNFEYDDGTEDSLLTTDFGKAWWNSTYGKKYNISIAPVSRITTTTEYPLRIVFNSSNINYSDFQSNGGDVRIINSDENATVPYFLQKWNNSGTSIIYVRVNITNSTATQVYLYGNSSTTESTTSSFLNTFGSAAKMLISSEEKNAASPYYWNDSYTGNRGGRNNTATTGIVINYSLIDGMKYGWTSYTANDDSKLDSGLPNGNYTRSSNFTTSFYLYMTAVDTASNGIFGCGDAANNGFLLQTNYAGANEWAWYRGSWYHTATPAPAANVLYHVTVRHEWTAAGVGANSVYLYLNGSLIMQIAPSTTSCTSGCNITWGNNYASLTAGQSAQSMGGYTDEHVFYSDVMSFNFINISSNLPLYNVSVSESAMTSTEMSSGVMVEWAEWSNQTVGEGEEFRYWVNYTFSVNSSKINNSFAWCNYTGTNISSEQYNETSGLNISICTSALCTHNPYYLTLVSGFSTQGFSFDDIKIRVCRRGNIGTGATVRTNCSASSQTLTSGDVPVCPAYVNYSIKNTWCGGNSTFLVNVSNNNGYNQRIELIDAFVGVDRFANSTGNMTFNATEQLWVSPEFEHYLPGNKRAWFNCWYNASALVQNKSSSINYAVIDASPYAYLSGIEDWYYGSQTFSTGTTLVKYPLVNSINISAGCIDSNWKNTTLYVNWTNGTNINTTLFTVSGESVTYSPVTWGFNELRNVQVLCYDSLNMSSSVIRTVNTSNDYPVVVWDNASGQAFSSLPLNFTVTCTDTEDDNLSIAKQYWYWVNDTINQSSVTAAYLNLSTLAFGTYNITVMCSDGSLNSTNATISFTYSSLCVNNVSGLVDGSRYADNTVEVSVNCVNSVNITDCWYSINDFANVYPANNCNSSFNISLELGWNRVNLTTFGNGLNSSSSFNVWAKKYDSDSFSDYAVIIFTGLFTVALFLVAGFIRSRLFFFMVGVGGLVLGYELISMSMFAGVFVVFCSALFSLAVMFRKQEGG